MSTIRAVAFGLLAVSAATMAACGGGDTGGAAAGDTAQPTMTATVAKRASITMPAEGDSVSGDSLRVVMSVEGVKLVPVNTATAARVSGEGHLHLLLDHDLTPPNVVIPPTNETIVHLGTGATEHVFTKLTKGPHRLIVVFAFTDHTPDTEVATDTVNVIVK
jgi:hypothetical protein